MPELTLDALVTHTADELAKICGMKIDPSTSLLDSGILDSLGLLELIVSVQDKFHITVDLSKLRKQECDTPLLMCSYFLRNAEA